MFTFAKFVSSALGFLTVSSTGAVVAPVTLTDSIYRVGQKTKNHLDLQSFNAEEKELKDKLETLKKQFQVALRFTSVFQKVRLERINKNFEEVKKEEGNLKGQYEELKKKIDKISELLTKQSLESQKKLHAQSASSLLGAFEKYLDSYSRHLQKQGKTILEVVCVIDKTKSSAQSPKSQQQTEAEGNCINKDWIKTLSQQATASAAPSAPVRSKRNAKPEEASASAEALKSLEGVRGKLFGLAQDISSKWQKSLAEKSHVAHEKLFLNTYVTFLEQSIQYMKLYQSALRVQMEADMDLSKSTVKKINELNAEMVEASKDWEKLKERYRVCKAYEGKLIDSLCSLHTFKTECPDSQAEQENL
ncbi:hypothetical protein MHLP_03275 [Candidatus Mycoplasma haematolamae str. Purdue]|uniref:Uncharacterized protein n=1 Tax=Mycoplasma haematolamae (strain Purdue) TaxID=1212765 RepID=I7BAB5_MYCHA|nr:hypothetical protein [Candidatus Mycoplasma haematolamae]AFO52235.1 hypothetical protein MHLP_03275 [Candidatus Mycoplasma haematolamae str. Purdue]